MKTFILNLFIIGLLISITPLTIKAQLFENIELYPKTKIIKGKYYNGTGGGGFWSLDFVDSIGRIIATESYRKKKLMLRQKFVYDKNNNKIFVIKTFDCNNPNQVDTSIYAYKYAENRIIYQYRKISKNDSNVITLIENKGDTLLKYQEQAFHYRPKTKMTDVFETAYTLKYKNSLLTCKEQFDKEQNSTEIKKYEYFENGKLKRRLIETIPEPKIKSYYTGGPGSDDDFYEYRLDSKTRIKKFYILINGKKIKLAAYSYN